MKVSGQEKPSTNDQLSGTKNEERKMFVSPREYFRDQGASPRKRFGQHFLIQPKTAERIVASATLCPADVVVEVGPGLGALTRFIAPRVGRLHLVELDRDLAAFLEANLADTTGKVSFYRQDILHFDFLSLAEREGESLVVLGNLPYNISSPLVFRLLESRGCIDRAVLMVQKEVGERLTAGPGGKDYGVLSVLLGVYARVLPLFVVGPGQFYPAPLVDSLVVSIDFRGHVSTGGPSFAFLRNFVNTCFQQRRKTLSNSLKGFAGRNPALLRDAFLASGIDPKRRPETLSVEEFVRLARALETRQPLENLTLPQ
jgi:16S rRNA (adenine1518-N6/adenine1519-N6)-dimethyltransferase